MLAPGYRFPMALSIHTACSLPPSEALPELTLQGFSPSTLHARSFQRSSPQPMSIYFPWFPVRPCCMQLSPSYFHGFLSVHAPVSSCLLPSRRSRPLFLWFPSSTLHARSLPVQPQAIFPRFLVRPRYMLAPFPWSSPQAISDSFLSVEVSPSYFPCTVSCPSTLHLSVPKLQLFQSVHATCSLPPNETLRKLAACSRSPQAISYSFLYRSTLHSRSSRSLPTDLGFLSVHNACLRSYFPRFLPTELSPRYFHGFLLFRTVPPSKALPKPFRTVPCPSILTAKQAKREPSIVDAFGKKNR